MWTQALLRKLQKSKTAKYGIPMLLLVVGGSFGLREFTQIRYDVHIIKKKMDPALEALINPKTQSVVLEEEFEKLKKTNLDSWKNIRGPRPWEDSQEYEEQKRANFSKGRTGTPGPS